MLVKRLVVLGALGLVGIFAACGKDSDSHRRSGKQPPADGGALGEGGEDQGGMAGDPGGAGSGPGGTGAGSGGASTGGRNTGGGGSGGLSGSGGIAGSGLVSGAGSGGSAGGPGVPCGFYDCSRLPHVRSDATGIECQDGVCVVPPDACEDDYAHCTTNANVGCETYLGSSDTCGGCALRCPSEAPVCADDGTGFHCDTGCTEPRPDRCGSNCYDLDTDVMNCGACGADCINANVEAECRDRHCVAVGPCIGATGDCDGRFGCETVVLTPENCGACGRNDCGATHASPDCSQLTACAKPTCDPGYGNCDRSSADCEATYGAACFPTYAGTRRLALAPLVAAVAPGGSFVLGGFFEGEIDFDASLGVDRLTTAYNGDGYVTRFDANGNYTWTRDVVAGNGFDTVTALAMTADGSTIVTGKITQTADLDPGPGVFEHEIDGVGGVFVSKLSPAGTLTWARVLEGNIGIHNVTADAMGGVYISGWFEGSVDLDPGPDEDLHEVTGFTEHGFLLKLDASGNFAWSQIVGGPGGEQWYGASVAPDGRIWGIGREAGGSTVAGTPLDSMRSGIFIAAFESTGALRQVSTLTTITGGPTARHKVATSAGAVHLSGPFSGEDLDPGAGVAARYNAEESAFLVHLDANGVYREAHVFPSEYPELAGTPNGVLVGVRTGDVRAYASDGVSTWSLHIGDQFSLSLLTSSTTHFIVVGGEYGTADYDPGSGEDPVYGSALVATRYAF